MIAHARWTHHSNRAEMTSSVVSEASGASDLNGVRLFADQNGRHAGKERDLDHEPRGREPGRDQVPDDHPGQADRVHLPERETRRTPR